MMKNRLKSTNYLYLVGIFPILIVDGVLGVRLPGTTYKYFLLVLLLACMILVVKKCLYLPNSPKVYGQLDSIDLPLPLPIDVKVTAFDPVAATTKQIVVMFSPFFFTRKEPVTIAINRIALQQEDARFMTMRVVRTFESYRQKTSIKIILGLIIPILSIIALVELFFIGKLKSEIQNAMAYELFFPPCIACITAMVFIGWNKMLSRQDYHLDRALLGYFPKDAVKQFIAQSTHWNGTSANEKERILMDHYTSLRLKKLETAK